MRLCVHALLCVCVRMNLCVCVCVCVCGQSVGSSEEVLRIRDQIPGGTVYLNEIDWLVLSDG